MPRIIPIQELKNAADISERCHSVDSPIFITKDGHSDMVIMSMKQYQRSMAKADIYAQLEEAEVEISQGKTQDAFESLARIRKKYRV